MFVIQDCKYTCGSTFPCLRVVRMESYHVMPSSNISLSYFLKHIFPLNLEIALLCRMPAQCAPVIHVSLPPTPSVWVGARLQTCTASSKFLCECWKTPQVLEAFTGFQNQHNRVLKRGEVRSQINSYTMTFSNSDFVY